MTGFFAIIVALFMAAGLGHGIGLSNARSSIWESCLATGQFTAKDTKFTCQAIEGKWDGQPVTFPKKTP